MDLSDGLDYQVLCLFDKMWNYPGKEMVVVYHNIQGLSEHIKIPVLAKMFDVKGGSDTVYYHPALVFTCLGIQTEFINTAGKTSVFKSEIITLNRYQECIVHQGKLTIKLKTPKILAPQTYNRLRFEEPSFPRHPQLRRIIKKFITEEGGIFNEDLLKENLTQLGSSALEYSFEDADEIILKNHELCRGCYLELLPSELKNIIIEYIEANIEIPEVIVGIRPIDTLFQAAESVVDNILEEQNVSIMDVFNKMRNNGSLDPLIKLAQDDQDGNLYKYMTSQLGLHSIVNVIKKKIE